MSTVANRRTPAVVEATRRTLDRPLASYQLVLGTSGMLLGLGLIMVLSASSVLAYNLYDRNSFAIIERQALFAVVGLVGAVIAARIPLSLLRKLVRPFLIVSILLILATFIPSVGLEINGNRNWLPLPGPLQLQPSEFAKLAVVLWIADLYARRQRKLGSARSILIPMVPVSGGVAALVVGQRDLGTALVLFAVIVGMLWVVGLPGRPMGAVIAGFAVVCVFFVAIEQERVTRMLSFINPMADPDRAGYQSIHSMMGFARGGFWGVGLGGSRQKWGALPEAHTDFILAVIGEELGLIGSFVVLILFGLFAVAGIRTATRTSDAFVRYTAAGIVIWIMSQAIINIGMVLGLLPVIGIPLPLLSYGGSSLLVTLVACGILLNCATTEPGARRALEAGKSRRQRGRAARRR